uniref:Uncharacterized protein n=1 Tax=Cucumis melo TaxID=3656 RepID=A0A9I9CKN3_CUCME
MRFTSDEGEDVGRSHRGSPSKGRGHDRTAVGRRQKAVGAIELQWVAVESSWAAVRRLWFTVQSPSRSLSEVRRIWRYRLKLIASRDAVQKLRLWSLATEVYVPMVADGGVCVAMVTDDGVLAWVVVGGW